MASQERTIPFVPGKTRIPLNVPSYGSPEVIEALDSLLSTYVTMGDKVQAFEGMWAQAVGMPWTVMVNSGSSANLLALSVMGLQPGDEVIVPAIGWSTTYFPIAQVGAIPVLVDVDPLSYNISPEAALNAVTPKTKAILVVHLLGNPCDMDAIGAIAHERGFYLMEDSCEAHGAEFKGSPVGSFGDIATWSFFFSHHITTIEGGMVATQWPSWYEPLQAMRAHGWIRELATREAIAAENPGIDPRFLFAYPGYNFRPTDLAGAFGIHQLPRLEGIVEQRRALAAYFNKALAPYEEWLQLPHEQPNTRHSYFAYAVTVKEGAPFTRKALEGFLNGKGLETRPIESGNMAIQPAMQLIPHRLAGTLANAQYIHDNAFFFGLHQGIRDEERDAIVGYFKEFFGELP